MFKGRVEKKEPKKDRKGWKQEESQKQRLSFKEKRPIHSMISDTKQRGPGQTKTQKYPLALVTWSHG